MRAPISPRSAAPRRAALALCLLAGGCNQTPVADAPADAASPADGPGGAPDLSPGRPPNFLLVIADDVGIAEIGAYRQVIPGSQPATTPTVDALAQAGVRFDELWATPACSPTRATVYTGRYTFRTGVGAAIGANMGGLGELKPCEVTLPKALGQKGYATALFGKWHLGTSSAAGNDSARQVGGFGYHAGAQDAGITNYYNWVRYLNGAGEPSTTYATTQNVNDALGWLAAQQGPWLAVMAFNAAHSPYHKPPADLFQGSLDGVVCNVAAGRRACYLKMIEAMDRELGRLLRAVDRSNTWVFFLGDNGTPAEVMSEGFDSTRGKFTLYQMGLRTPFIVAGPGLRDPGRSVSDLVNSTDIYATITTLAGLGANSSAQDSRSLVPYLTGATSSPRVSSYADTFRGVGPHTQSGQAALQDGRYKIIEKAGALAECYDLAADPSERNNLVGAATPDACRALHAAMERSHLAGIACP